MSTTGGKSASAENGTAIGYAQKTGLRLGTWLRRMIMEIVGKQFVQQLPITTALHFDRVATDNRLSCLRCRRSSSSPLGGGTAGSSSEELTLSGLFTRVETGRIIMSSAAKGVSRSQ